MPETTKVNVCKVTLLIVDTDDLGEREIRSVIENVSYPNHCVNPRVMKVEAVEVDYHDQHPINMRKTMDAEFTRLFPQEKP